MSAPIQLIFVVAIVAALVIECESLKCWLYVPGVDPTEQTCTYEKYCGKAVVDGKSYGSCDDSDVCSSNGCLEEGDNKLCCCDTDLCNTDNSVASTVKPCNTTVPCKGNFVASTLTATAVSLIFVFFSRYITY